MTTIGEAIIEVHADTSHVGSDLDRGVSSSSGRMSKLGGTLGKGLGVAFGAAAGGILAGGAFLKGAFDEATEAQKVGAQTTAVLKSTGGAAQVSAKHVSDLAGAISKKAGIDDEAIQSGENLLLTFKGIQNQAGKGNDIFDQTTKTLVDMSTAMGQEPQQAAIQLGKALNDPAKGMTALTRVGVTFTDQQSKQIKAMQAAGNTAGAQKIILKELNSEFGGSAAAQATAADKAGVAWGNLKEQIGTALMPVFNKVFTFISDKGIPAISSFATNIGKVKPYIDPVVGAIKGLFNSFSSGGGSGKLSELSSTFSSVFGSIKSIVKSAVTIVMVLWHSFGSTIVSFATHTFSNLLQMLRGVFKIIAGVFKVFSSLLTGDWKGVWQGIKMIASGAWSVIKALVKQGWNTIKTLFSVMGTIVKGIFGRLWDGIKTLAGKAWDGIKSIVGRGADGLVSFIKSIPGRITSGASHLFSSAGGKLLDALVNGLKASGGAAASFAESIWSAVKGAINSGIDSLNNLLSFSIDVGPKTFTVNPPDIGHLYRGTESWRGGATWVGERGPELLNLPRGSSVVPAARSARMAGAATRGGGGGMVGSITITNWDEGTGYFRTLAADEVTDADDFAASIGRMRR